MTNVYFMKSDDGNCKVGHSKNVDFRLKQVSKEVDCDLELVYFVEVGNLCRRVEKRAHLLLTPFNIKGEWFSCPKEAAIQAIQSAITIENEIGPEPDPEPSGQKMTGSQIAAARALLGWGQEKLATVAKISVPTLRRMEASGSEQAPGMANNLEAVRRALEAAGVIFIPENGEGAGVRLAKRKNE